MTQRKVLLTGATGFVGRHIVPALIRRGYDVHAVGRRPPEHDVPGLTFHNADLLDPGASAPIVTAIEATHLVHLAWYVKPGLFWRARENLDWVAASLVLYRTFAAAGGRRLVVLGTCAEYDWSYPVLDEVSTPCRPTTLYGVAKHALHELLAAAAREDGIELAWARLFFMYGPHEAPSRLVPDVVLSLLNGDPALCTDGRAQRDFMHVDDVAGACAAVLDSAHVGPVNIASGDCVPLRDVIKTVADRVGRADLVRLGARPSPASDPERLQATTAILRDVIGFQPGWSREDGLCSTVDWWRSASRARQGQSSTI